MKIIRRIVSSLVALAAAAVPCLAVDHDNVDAGRPLRFDDAESIAFRERALEFGFDSSGNFGAEYLVGLRVNTHLNFDLDRRSVGIGVFHNINRESLTTPAFAVRADVGDGLRLRAIASRTVRQYSRLHVNVDLERRRRETRSALTLGLTRPLGYPTRFDRTGLAELGVRSDGTIFTGVGVRQQVTLRGVVDLGIQSDLRRGSDPFRVVAGYSSPF